MKFNITALTTTPKMRLLEEVTKYVASKPEYGPYTGMKIVLDGITNFITSQTPIKHKDIREQDAASLTTQAFTLKDLDIFRSGRSARRDLIQKIMVTLIDENHLNVEDAKLEVSGILSTKTSEYFTAEEIQEISDAQIIHDLDINYVFTANRISAIQSLLSYTTMNAKAAFEHINSLSGKEISAVRHKITENSESLRSHLRELSKATGNLNVDEMIEELKRKAVLHELDLDAQYINYILTEKFVTDMKEQIYNAHIDRVFRQQSDNFIKTTLSQTYAQALAIRNTFSTWLGCVVEKHCPRIIPYAYSTSKATKELQYKVNLNDTNKSHERLLSLAESIIDECHEDIATVVWDMRQISNTTDSEICRYESHLKALKLNSTEINDFFTNELKTEIQDTSNARALRAELQNDLSILTAFIFSQTVAARPELVTDFAKWVGCYIQNNNCDLLSLAAFWGNNDVPAISNSMSPHYRHAAADHDLTSQYVVSSCMIVLAIIPFAKLAYDMFFKSHFFKPAAKTAKEEYKPLESIKIKTGKTR